MGRIIGECKECGKTTNVEYGGMCQGCYRYFKDGGLIHEKPKYGEIKTDVEGKLICHICGRSFTKLGSHAFYFHGITRHDYCKQFGLDLKKGLTSQDYIDKMREMVYSNPHIIENNLIKSGEKSRYVNGSKGRTKEQVSEQTRIRLSKRGLETIKKTKYHLIHQSKQN